MVPTPAAGVAHGASVTVPDILAIARDLEAAGVERRRARAAVRAAVEPVPHEAGRNPPLPRMGEGRGGG